TRARRARARPSAPAPASLSRAPWRTATRDIPCSRQRASSPRPSASRGRLTFDVGTMEGARALVDLLQGLLRVVAVRELRQRILALDDPRVPVSALLGDELVQSPRLADILGDVRRERRRHLPFHRQVERELRLL